MTGGLALVALLAVFMILLAVIAGRHLDRLEADEDAHRHDLLAEIRREARRQELER